jgi:hypothetical protein
MKSSLSILKLFMTESRKNYRNAESLIRLLISRKSRILIWKMLEFQNENSIK